MWSATNLSRVPAFFASLAPLRKSSRSTFFSRVSSQVQSTSLYCAACTGGGGGEACVSFGADSGCLLQPAKSNSPARARLQTIVSVLVILRTLHIAFVLS